jgi:hypothetical protein
MLPLAAAASVVHAPIGSCCERGACSRWQLRQLRWVMSWQPHLQACLLLRAEPHPPTHLRSTTCSCWQLPPPGCSRSGCTATRHWGRTAAPPRASVAATAGVAAPHCVSRRPPQSCLPKCMTSPATTPRRPAARLALLRPAHSTAAAQASMAPDSLLPAGSPEGPRCPATPLPGPGAGAPGPRGQLCTGDSRRCLASETWTACKCVGGHAY